ncbi:sensor histidine kinase [Actinoplanes sp. NPDC020271]|uniref:sensor histidine kinase n=1 Tax=Actinoplanes sp. NPDC020271 TaxID=3363896 RepID=UPI00379DB1EF
MRLRQITAGFCRGPVLAGLTSALPLVALVVGWGGALFAGTWSPGPGAPLIGRIGVGIGQVGAVLLWLAGALWMTHALTSRPLAQAARRLSRRWLGLDRDVTYRAPVPVTRMATGFWWDGVEYHRSQREARRRAGMNARFHDPQVKRDGLWAAVAGVTVFPVTALPLLGVAGGLGLVVSGRTPIGLLILVLSLVASAFSWRILRPVAERFLGPDAGVRLGRRVQELETIQADLTQTQAAELERIERGLHDGAQARLVAMGMSMQAAERMIDRDPEAAKAVLADARASSRAALEELRSLVRGINPPVLVERGLVDAVRALALDVPVEVQVHAGVPARPERPVESAIYFAVAELLANVAKHAHAEHVTVDLAYTGNALVATVTDDGVGGIPAMPDGSGLAGIARRMAAFGGSLQVVSPAGGPTRATVSVPCVW